VKAQTLPFTGLSLVWTAIAGFAMLLLGIALRRREQRR
jgi:LPXTG-motif cell wall-anchored protein